MGPILRTALLLLVYPVLIAGVRFSWNTPQRFVTWGTASLVGVAVFVVLFVQLPASFDLFEMGPRIARPLVAYAGGLVVTGIIVMVTRRRTPHNRQ
jgi:hypothetical protein